MSPMKTWTPEALIVRKDVTLGLIEAVESIKVSLLLVQTYNLPCTHSGSSQCLYSPMNSFPLSHLSI